MQGETGELDEDRRRADVLAPGRASRTRGHGERWVLSTPTPHAACRLSVDRSAGLPACPLLVSVAVRRVFCSGQACLERAVLAASMVTVVIVKE